MVWIVITINLLLSLSLLWATWQIWQLKNTLSNVANTVNGYAKNCYKGLFVFPPAILISQKGSGALRQQYKALLLQLEKLQAVLKIFGLLLSLVAKLIPTRRLATKSEPRGANLGIMPSWANQFRQLSHKSKESDRNGKWRG